MDRRGFLKAVMGAVASVAVFGADTQLTIVKAVPQGLQIELLEATLRVVTFQDFKPWLGVIEDSKDHDTVGEYNRTKK